MFWARLMLPSCDSNVGLPATVPSTRSRKTTFSISDPELWPMILIFEHDLDGVQNNQSTKHLGQRLLVLSYCVDTQTYAYRHDCSIWTTDVIGIQRATADFINNVKERSRRHFNPIQFSSVELWRCGNRQATVSLCILWCLCVAFSPHRQHCARCGLLLRMSLVLT